MRPQPAALLHNPQAPGARSTRSCAPRAWTRDPTRHSARRAVAHSGPLRGPAHLTPHIRKWRPTNALSDLTELQRSHEGCHAVHRVAQERAPRDAAAAPARKWDYPGTRGKEHLDADSGGIRRDSVGFGRQSGTESGIKWDKVGLKWDSEGRAAAVFDRGSDGTQADGCSRRDARSGAPAHPVFSCCGPLALARHGATLARAPPAVHRTMFRGVERIGGTLFPAAAARSPRAGPSVLIEKFA